MNFYDRALAAKGDYGTLALDKLLTDELLAILRRDWAVRVLDAWADVCDEQWSVRKETDDGDVYVVVLGFDEDAYHHGDTPAAARTFAALAVFPELPADVRAELGECP